MAKERRDSKNRLLGKGEYQKADGRYMYRYTDANGVARFVYSWTLTKTDRAPKGKASEKCLRDLEKEIARDLVDGIDRYGGNNTTLNDYFELYMNQKTNLRSTTRRNYKRNYDLYIRERIGNRKIASIKHSDIKNCYRAAIDERGISVATISNVNAFLKPIFQMAVMDDVIRYNPISGVITELNHDCGERPEKKCALSVGQQNAFMNFVSDSKVYKKWKNLFAVMLGTGCRMGEICGLVWDDCDFDGNMIYIRRTLSYYPDEYSGKCIAKLHMPKTAAGARCIPMFKDVRDALLNEYNRQLAEGFCDVEIDGISGFVFFSRSGGILRPRDTNDVIDRIVKKHNELEVQRAFQEGGEPFLLPKFSPHILRHTFCTRMCESGVDVKVVQEVMGHASITTTMDIYNNITSEYKIKSFNQVDGMFRIG